MKLKICIAVMLCFLMSACGNGNKKLKPPKKSPCACADIVVDMEKIHV